MTIPLHIPKRPPLLALFALLFSGAIGFAAAPPSIDEVDYEAPPEGKSEIGLIRVWNGKREPPEGPATPEAQLGDVIVLELSNLEQWLCQNLQEGAWPEDQLVVTADSVAADMIREKKLWSAVSAALQMEGIEALSRTFDPKKTSNKTPNSSLRKLPESNLSEFLQVVDWGDYLSAEEIESLSNNPAKARRTIETCKKALRFIRDFAKHKTSDFVLTINSIPLPGLAAETPEPKPNWRSEEERDLAAFLDGSTYIWYQFRLYGQNNSEFMKAWPRLMKSIESEFSCPSEVSLALPGGKIPLTTGVIRDAPDLRCRFNLLNVKLPQRQAAQLSLNDEVYLLDERDIHDNVKKGTIVGTPKNPGAPYVVHFTEIGGTKGYDGTELARLPPDPVPQGVVRVWNANDRDFKLQNAQTIEIPRAKVGDRLVVEVRNFEAWLAHQIDNGLLQDEPLLLKATQTSKGLDSLIKAKRFSATVKVGAAARRILEGSPQERPSAIQWELYNDPDMKPLLPKKLTEPNPTVVTVEDSFEEDFAEEEEPAETQTVETEKEEARQKPTVEPKKEENAPNEVDGTEAEAKKAAEKEEAAAKKAAKKEEAEKKEDQEAQKFLSPYQDADSVLQELAKNKLRSLVLTINDLPLGMTADNVDFNVTKQRRPPGSPKQDSYTWLTFSLSPKSTKTAIEEDKADEDVFKRLLANPRFTMLSEVTLTLKAGSENLIVPTAVTPVAKDARCRFALIGIEWQKFWPMTAVFIAILAALAFFAVRTNILRDPCRRRLEGVECLSLARAQMAFWFVIIAAAFAFLWVTTGNTDTINITCLTLLAIGTTTALSSLAIQRKAGARKDLSDVLRKTPEQMLLMHPLELKKAIDARRRELQRLRPGQTTPEALAEDLAVLDKQETELDCFLKSRPSWRPFRRLHYWRYRMRMLLEDLLTEEAGTYDFHRFQILAWTVLLGAVFIAKVIKDKAMPEFDTNLLLLMGISSGAYIGFKAANPRRAEAKKEETKSATPTP